MDTGLHFAVIPSLGVLLVAGAQHEQAAGPPLDVVHSKDVAEVEVEESLRLTLYFVGTEDRPVFCPARCCREQKSQTSTSFSIVAEPEATRFLLAT